MQGCFHVSILSIQRGHCTSLAPFSKWKSPECYFSIWQRTKYSAVHLHPQAAVNRLLLFQHFDYFQKPKILSIPSYLAHKYLQNCWAIDHGRQCSFVQPDFTKNGKQNGKITDIDSYFYFLNPFNQLPNLFYLFLQWLFGVSASDLGKQLINQENHPMNEKDEWD